MNFTSFLPFSQSHYENLNDEIISQVILIKSGFLIMFNKSFQVNFMIDNLQDLLKTR